MNRTDNQPKTFYIAGRAKNVVAIRRVAALLIEQGYQWSYDWTISVAPEKPYGPGNEPASLFASACLDGIRQAHVFILLATDSLRARGMFIELGYALACGVPTWIIGDEDPSVFSSLAHVRHATNVDNFEIQWKGAL